MPPDIDPAIHVITLARTPQRWAAFQARNSHLPLRRVEAVDGSTLTEDDIRGSGRFAPGLAYTPGAYGCALSHLALWEEAIGTGRALTVAEDDAIFRLDFAQQRQRVLASLPDEWELVMWGWNLDCSLWLNALAGVAFCRVDIPHEWVLRNIDAFQGSMVDATALALWRCFGIPAYTISAAGARRLRAFTFPLRPAPVVWPVTGPHVNNGIDVAMNASFGVTASYAVLPPLAFTPNDQAITTIQAPRPR